MNPILAGHAIDAWLNTLAPGSSEHSDLDTALNLQGLLDTAQPSYLLQTSSHTRPLAVLDNVERLRHWQTHSQAPEEVKEAMGALADELRKIAGRKFDQNLLTEIERLRGLLAVATKFELDGPGSVAIAQLDADGSWWVFHPKAGYCGHRSGLCQQEALELARKLSQG